MADRFVNDILSDDSPVVTTSRYTDTLFGPAHTGYAGISSNHNNTTETFVRGIGVVASPLGNNNNNNNNNNASNRRKSHGAVSFASPRDDDDFSSPAVVGGGGSAFSLGNGDAQQQQHGADSASATSLSSKPILGTRESEDLMRQVIAHEIQWMLRFALLFINFTFIVAALLMALAGAIAVNTSALAICAKCQRLAMAPVVLGVGLWFSGLFAFYWIKQRTVLFLLIHAGTVLFVTLGIFIVVIIGIAFNGEINTLNEGDLLTAWTHRRDNITPSLESPLCDLQFKNNCSGVKYGCCRPGVCYNASAPPSWVSSICADCFVANKKGVELPTQMCKWDLLQRTTTDDMEGFIIVLSFSFILCITGSGLALFVRKINAAGSSDGK